MRNTERKHLHATLIEIFILVTEQLKSDNDQGI